MNLIRKQLLVMLLLFACASVYAQLTGVKTIDNSLPTGGSNYASFADAIADLNIQGVGTGGVTFNVTAGQTFNEVPLTVWASGTATDPILFVRSGTGPNPKIMPSQAGVHVPIGFATQADHIFRIAGSDYLTIDGIDLQAHPMFSTDSTKAEYGYYITKLDASNASKNVTITHCSVDMNSNPVMWVAHSAAFFVSNHDTTGTELTIMSEAGRHEYINIRTNTVANSYNGIVVKGFEDPSDPYAYYDHFMTVDSNTISTYGGPVDSYVIYFNGNDSNTITANNTNTFTQGSGALYGIFNGYSWGATSTITGNIINQTTPMSTAMTYGIYNLAGSLGTGNVIDIGLNQLMSTVNNQYVCIQNDGGAPVVNIYGNSLSSSINMGPSGSSTYVIWSGPAGNTTVTNIYDNNFHGAYLVNGSNVSTLFGIICQNGGLETNVYRNRVYDLMQNGGGQVVGIRSNAPNCNLYNNYVYDLKTSNTVHADAVKGIDINANGPAVLNHNTVVINAAPGMPGTFGTSALYVSSSVTTELNNNIFVNLSASGVVDGYTAAYKRDNTTLNTHLNVSNNNCYYTNPGTRSALFYDNTNADSTIQAFRLRLGPGRESLSFSELPPFASTSSPFNLQLSTTTPTQCESAGKPTAVTTDFYQNPRNVSTPDVGAEEGSFTGTDLSGPTISFTPVGNTSLLSNITISNVDITDPSGINFTSGMVPRLYFKKTSDPNEFNGNTMFVNGWKYTEVTGMSAPFTFVTDYSLFSSGIGIGDTIQYFIAAQDGSVNANVGAYIAFSTKQNPISLDSIFPVFGPISEYKVLPSLFGTHPVGVGSTLVNLNNVADALANNVLTGDVVFELQSAYAGGETFPVVFRNISKDNPDFTITIRPASGVTGIVTQGDPGAVTLPLIDLDGVSHITFDGRQTGASTGINWTIRNTRTATPFSIGPVFHFANGSQLDTLRYLQIEGETSASNGLVFFGAASASAGNTLNAVTNCKIRNRSDVTAVYSAGVVSSGTSAFPNMSNTVKDNEIFNFTNYGVNVDQGSGSGWTISGNHLYNNHSTPPASAQRAILFVPGTGSNQNLISGNFIGGSAPSCAGTPWTNTGSTANFRGIDVDCDAVEVTGNRLRNFAWTGTSGNAWTGILLASSVQAADITYNIIGDSLLGDTIRVMGTNATIGISTAASGTVNITNNGIHMLYANRAATNAGTKGILNSGNNANVTIANNSISNLYTTSTRVNLTTTADFAINGILSSSSGTVNISNNTVKKLSVLTPGTTVVATAGIACSRSAGSTITANRIYDLGMASVGDSNRIFGIAVFEAPAPVTIANNMIALGNSQSANVYGIGHEGNASATAQVGPLNVIHNTVLVNGTVSSGTTASNSYAFYSRFSTPTVLQNNILTNLRSGGSGNHIAAAQVSATPSTGWTSDYNTVWASTTAATTAWGSPAVLGDLAAWQVASSSDLHSQQQLISFVDVSTADLHLASIWNGDLLLKGTNIPSVMVDFDGETRTMHPYMGADEVVSHPLPVKLLAFSAARSGSAALLKWHTASEINSDRFVIERSTDGKTFENIGSVKASGGLSKQMKYEYRDASAPFETSRSVYYRLKITDRDGAYAYSNVAILTSALQTQTTEISAYPNPFSDQMSLDITAEASGSGTVTITDMAGRMIFSRSYQLETGANSIDVTNDVTLSEGVYFLSLQNGSASQTIKLIKH